jgi:predicted MFS family arabinose efflux permease
MNYMAKTCPKGTEATTFALLCSVVNFGGFLSGIVGGKLYNMMGYNGLVIISGVTTLITLMFIPFLKVNKT